MVETTNGIIHAYQTEEVVTPELQEEAQRLYFSLPDAQCYWNDRIVIAHHFQPQKN